MEDMYTWLSEPSKYIHSFTHLFLEHTFTEGFLCVLASDKERVLILWSLYFYGGG